MNEAIQRFVIVSADAALIASVEAAVGDLAVLDAAPGLAEARSLLGNTPLAGIIVDASALRGAVSPQLAALRAANPLVNILFVANELRAVLLNDIQPLRIDLLARPLPPGGIDTFVQRTLSAGRLSDREVAAYIERLASEHKLSGNDIALFPLVLERETPEALCARLNIDRDALTRGLRRLVKKCRVRNTDRLAKNLMRDALLFASAPSARSYTLASAAA